MRTVNTDLIWNFKLLEDVCCLLHDRKIRIAAHDDADKRFHFCFESPLFPMSFLNAFPSNSIISATK